MAPVVKSSWLTTATVLLTLLVSLANSASINSPTTQFRLGDVDANCTTNHSGSRIHTNGKYGHHNPIDSVVVKHNSTSAGACRMVHRKEWRKMTTAEKSDYINALQCLQRLKPISGIAGSKSNFDDFQATHIQLTPHVHQVGQFLAWHRWFVSVYETTLREKCGYKGGQPYWELSLDVHNFPKSPVFDPKTGFGSLVRKGPVPDGPFSKYRLNFGTGPYPNITSHRLEREYDSDMLKHLTQSEVDKVLLQNTFERFRIELEGRPATPSPRIHDAGHRIIGGDGGDPWSSPGEPLFYLHHANLDRIWWKWQNSRPGRMHEISGRTTQNPPHTELTLDFVMEMGKLSKPVSIRNIMNVERNLCYTYA